AGFRVEAPWPVDSPKSTGAAEMSTSTIEGLATALATIFQVSEIPPENHANPKPQTQTAMEDINDHIREGKLDNNHNTHFIHQNQNVNANHPKHQTL
ncbi:hypothetical protein, partial [Enterobacter asburiae]